MPPGKQPGLAYLCQSRRRLKARDSGIYIDTLLHLKNSPEMETPSPNTSASSHFSGVPQSESCVAFRLRIRLYKIPLPNIHRGNPSVASRSKSAPVAASQSIPAPCSTILFHTGCSPCGRWSRIDRHSPRVPLSHPIRGALISYTLPRRWDARGITSSSAFPIGLPSSLTKRNRNRAGHVTYRHLPRRGPIMPHIRPRPAAPKMTAPTSGTAPEATLRLPETGFLRQPQVLSLVPFSKSTLWRRIQAKTFPHPVKLSERITVWRAEDIRRWIAEQGG